LSASSLESLRERITFTRRPSSLEEAAAGTGSTFLHTPLRRLLSPYSPGLSALSSCSLQRESRKEPDINLGGIQLNDNKATPAQTKNTPAQRSGAMSSCSRYFAPNAAVT